MQFSKKVHVRKPHESYSRIRAGNGPPNRKGIKQMRNNSQENTLKTHHSQIMVAKVREADFDEISSQIQTLIDLYPSQDNLKIVSQMKAIVPEYISKNSIYSKLDKK